MSTKARFVIVVVAVAVSLLAAAREAEAQCNPYAMSPCLGAISSGAQPSSACCSAVKSQGPCLCQYYRDPTYSQYIGAAKKIVSTCKVTVRC